MVLPLDVHAIFEIHVYAETSCLRIAGFTPYGYQASLVHEYG